MHGIGTTGTSYFYHTPHDCTSGAEWSPLAGPHTPAAAASTRVSCEMFVRSLEFPAMTHAFCRLSAVAYLVNAAEHPPEELRDLVSCNIS